jgi:hypothetical protein
MPTSKPKKPGIVHKVTTHHGLPTVTRKPEGSHRHIVDEIPNQPYWVKVKKAYLG